MRPNKVAGMVLFTEKKGGEKTITAGVVNSPTNNFRFYSSAAWGGGGGSMGLF